MRRKIVKGKYLRVGVTSHHTRLHCSADRVDHANFNPDLEVPSCFEANMEAMHDRKFSGRRNTFPERICFLWTLRGKST